MRLDVRRFQLSRQRRTGTVHQDRADIIEQLLCTILTRVELEKLRILVDKVRVDDTVEELLILQDIQQERYIRLYAAHAELTEGAIHLGARGLKVTGVGDHLSKDDFFTHI